jgi:CRISPR/Cas system-associated endoribonuclease Cas2
MRGKFMLAVLEALSEAPGNLADGLEAFLQAGYGASSGKMFKELHLARRRRQRRNEEQRARRRYAVLVSKLKRDGLIKTGGPQNIPPALTKKGREKLERLRSTGSVSLPQKTYSFETSSLLTIVAFDIPEREKWKREWLRGVLKRLGLTMIQKSVWTGKIKIPQEFVDDLSRMKILDSVEIFQVTRTGTLRHVA